MARRTPPKKCQRGLDDQTIARVQQPHGVEIHEEQASSRAPDKADPLPKKQTGQTVCPAVVGGLLPPPGNQRKPGQQQGRYDEEPDHLSRQRNRPHRETRTVSSTEVGLPIVLTSESRNAATGRASVACTSSHGASQLSLRGEEADRTRA